MQAETEYYSDQHRFGVGRFPNPTVMDAGISSADVENEDGSSEVKNVLWSTSGSYYEFSTVIKKSIYGLVVKANVLEPISTDSFRRTGKEVAIKVCANDVLVRNGGVSLENPITEIGAMQDIGEPRHPNVASQFECCVDDKNIYSVLKFHRGVELFDHILNCGPMNETAARCMFQQLMLAVFRLQQRGMSHRDISLENIMYDASNHATVLIDFGLCVKLQRDPLCPSEYQRVPNAACGKGYYMPPESSWDGRLQLVNPMEGDIWSAGMCLLYVLLGFPPIERASDDDVRYRFLTTGRLPELLDHWEVDLSPPLVDLLQLILNPEAGERPSVQQILQHNWVQTDGPACPFHSEIPAEEFAAACGWTDTVISSSSSSTGDGNINSSLSTVLYLQHPQAHSNVSNEWSDRGMHSADDHFSNTNSHPHYYHQRHPTGMGGGGGGVSITTEMSTDCGCTTREGEGEEGEMSYRSSVESRWSSTTTPTGTHHVPNSTNNNHNTENNQNNAQLAAMHLAFHAGNAYLNNTNDTQTNSSSSSSNIQGGGMPVGGLQIQIRPPLPPSSSCCSTSASGVSSGAATPSTHVPSYQNQNLNNYDYDLRVHTGDADSSSSNGGGGGDCSPVISGRYSNNNASTTVTNSTNTSSSSSNAKPPNPNFTGYHTRSHSFGKSAINYAV